MILRPLVKIHSRFYILKIGGKEIPFETRMEYAEGDKRGFPARERCIAADGSEAEHETAFLQPLGIVAPWNRETGMVGGKQVEFFPAGPPDAMLILLQDCTLQLRDCYFRDLVQEKREREGSKPFTKLPLEYVTNLIDLSEKERDLIFRSLDRQMSGKKGEVADPPPPPEPTPEELSNIDQLPPPELETLINKIEAHQKWDKLKQTAYEKAAWWSCNLDQAKQSQRCTHIKPNGSTCGSPAIKDKTFCYWHEQTHLHRTASAGLLLNGDGAHADAQQLAANGHELTRPGPGEPAQSAAFEMPVLEDRLGVQLGIMRVCDLLAGKSIDPYTARVMLYGLRLAQRTLGDQNGLNGQHQ